MNCPNCSTPIAAHSENGCVLAALIDVIRARGTRTEKQLQALHANADADAFWESVGPIVDSLESGEFHNDGGRP